MIGPDPIYMIGNRKFALMALNLKLKLFIMGCHKEVPNLISVIYK